MLLGAEQKQEVTSGFTLLSAWVPNSGGQGCIKVLTGSSLAACCCGSSVAQPSGVLPMSLLYHEFGEDSHLHASSINVPPIQQKQAA